MKVAIIDYGMGNIYSISQACKKVGIDVEATSSPNDVESSSGLIIPGVGAFKPAIDRLISSRMYDAIKKAISEEKPVLGICLGMQLLANRSFEHGEHEGLGVVKGDVVKFPKQNNNIEIKTPNIGWSLVNSAEKNNSELWPLLNNRYFYFLHSYYFQSNEKDLLNFYSENNGFKFCAAFNLKSILAVQFHPEKSGEAGLDIFEYYKRMI